jgi:RHS repeat-associated protein
VGPISEHTNARPHCSFQLGTTTQYGTTWLSVASSTDETGTVVQTLDYYPYGSTRISSGQNATSRQFIGQFSDQSNLSYFNARYYSSDRGQFISQDPTFLAIGDPSTLGQLTKQDQPTLSSDVKQLTGPRKMDGLSWTQASVWRGRSIQDEYLRDPQTQNSYSYARGNPIRLKDPDGLWYKEFITGQQTWPSFQLELGEAANQLAQDSPVWNYSFEHPVKTGLVVGLASGFGASSAAGGIILGAGFNATNATVGLVNAYGWQQTGQAYLNYRATGSQSARNQAAFDGVVSAAAGLGTVQQRQALNILSAALTALQAALPSIVQSAQSAPQQKH